MLTGNVTWIWEEQQQKAFDEIKNRMTTAPALRIPNDKDPYKIEVDASYYATEAILSQKQEGKWHPITFQSKSFTEPERNYATYDKELLAIIQALEE